LRSSGGIRLRGHDALADADLAIGRFEKSRDQPQRRGFAAAGGAKQAHQLSVIDRERNIIDDRERSKSPAQAAQFNGRQSTPPRLFFAAHFLRLFLRHFSRRRTSPP